jgi:hypothetical protein
MHVRSNRQLMRLAFDVGLVARVNRKAEARAANTGRPAAQHSTLQANYFIAS